jgi:RsiW-degrading membrane proteinase PrsW (M82 family)
LTCWQCGREVPSAAHCVVCGNSLAEELAARTNAAGRFRANPDEPARGVRVMSTLFPQLPRADLDSFRLALLAGVALVVGLTVLGLYPLAVLVAAAVVPLLVVLYVIEIDVFEDEPPQTLIAMLAWGVIAGIVAAVLTELLASRGAAPLADRTPEIIAGAAGAIAQLVAILIGPLLLLRNRRFNDVLDGATFGVAAAAGFAASYTIARAVGLFEGGLQPGGDTSAWVITTLNVALARPLLLIAAAGSACAAFWLRYRVPARDRAALGLLGSPPAAIAAAAVLLVAGSASGVLLPNLAATIARGLLAALALLWLRAAIQVGLRQEAAEVRIGTPVTCANCGHETAEARFCGNCGVSLRALPRRGRRRTAPPDGDPR